MINYGRFFNSSKRGGNGLTMNKSFSIDLRRAENVQSRSFDYFEKCGFNIFTKSPNRLEFKRGSILINSVTFNPLKWKSKIIVEIKDEELLLHLRITTYPQLVTDKEVDTWLE